MYRLLLAGSLTVFAVALFGGTARAAIPNWDCRASALRSQVLTTTNEPVVANDPFTPCVAEVSANTGDTIDEEVLPLVNLSSDEMDARTTLAPTGVFAIDQTAGASGGITGDVGIDASGVIALTITGATATASASCVGTTPTLSGSYGVTSINVQPLVGSPISIPITPGTTSLPTGLGSVVVGEQVVAGGSLTERAVRVTLTLPLADPVEFVIGEARVAATGAVCDRSAYPPPPWTPPGGVPNSGGGNTISLAEARRLYGNLPCLRGKSPTRVIVGTAGNDKIKGTAGKDRILGLGGNDRLAGGSGHDCVDGGAGNDLLTGDRGNDGLYGDRGNDTLNGGAGNDRIISRSGRTDRSYGGPGKDRLSIRASKARVSCGTGKDRATISRKMTKRPAGCERVAKH